jgi:LPXTG-motif cell wall-anchored protein
MKSSRSRTRLRLPSIAIGVALLSGALLAGAAPAHAADEPYDVTGTVLLQDAAGGVAPAAAVQLHLTVPDSSPWAWPTEVDGSFSFENLQDGDYTLEVGSRESTTHGLQTVEFTIAGSGLVLDPIVLLPYLDKGTISVSGKPIVGEELTISTAGWPAGVTYRYSWWYSGGMFGSEIDDATSATLLLTEDLIGYWVGGFVTAEKAGFSPTTISLFQEDTVSAPKRLRAPAPVAHVDDLPAYLAGKGATAESQQAVGLGVGALDPAEQHTAKLEWWAQDSFVDVYLYGPTPIFVGTFPVLDWAVRIDLDPELLSQLEAGGHTLVVLGQSSDAVSSVSLSLDEAHKSTDSDGEPALAATGADPTLALAASAFLLLAGAGAILATRRRRSEA